MFAIPVILDIVTNPVTIFGDAGTLAVSRRQRASWPASRLSLSKPSD